MSNETEQRLAALEVRIEHLEQCYRDVAYEFTDALVKRIEDIRDAVQSDLHRVSESLNTVSAEIFSSAFERISKTVEEAKKTVETGAVLSKFTDGSHEFVQERRPGSGAVFTLRARGAAK